MTNVEIIAHSAIAAGLYSKEEVEAIFAAGNILPLFTYAEWSARGFQVRKGEKAKLVCDIWRHKDKKKEQDSSEEVDESSFYKKKAHFFGREQVDKVERA